MALSSWSGRGRQITRRDDPRRLARADTLQLYKAPWASRSDGCLSIHGPSHRPSLIAPSIMTAPMSAAARSVGMCSTSGRGHFECGAAAVGLGARDSRAASAYQGPQAKRVRHTAFAQCRAQVDADVVVVGAGACSQLWASHRPSSSFSFPACSQLHLHGEICIHRHASEGGQPASPQCTCRSESGHSCAPSGEFKLALTVSHTCNPDSIIGGRHFWACMRAAPAGQRHQLSAPRSHAHSGWARADRRGGWLPAGQRVSDLLDLVS